MTPEQYDAIYKLDAYSPDADPEHDRERARSLEVNETIARSYGESKTECLIEIPCGLMSMNQEKRRVQISVACENMSYELIRFASTKLLLHFVDADGKAQTLELYAAHGECENTRHRPHGAINCIPVPRVSLYLTHKTNIPDSMLIYKSIAGCTLMVSARGMWPSKIKSWDYLSDLEIKHRCGMKMLFSLESVGAACDVYNTRIHGDILFRMRQDHEYLSPTQRQALTFLQDLQKLYVDLTR